MHTGQSPLKEEGVVVATAVVVAVVVAVGEEDEEEEEEEERKELAYPNEYLFRIFLFLLLFEESIGESMHLEESDGVLPLSESVFERVGTLCLCIIEWWGGGGY
jgi:hypothetical protein